MYQPTTLKDIALELGLSISTVSRAIADCYQISEKTRKKVADAAVRMNYRRNPIALRLKDKRSYAIGVVISKVDNVFFSLIIDGIESIAYDRGYHVIITQSHESFEREVINVKHLMENCVDGLLISVAAESVEFSHVEKFQNKGAPVVFFDRALEGLNAHKVLSNNLKGAFDATDYLIKKGCKTIAFLGDAKHLSIIQQRKSGYESALEKYGITVDSQYIKYCDPFKTKAEEVERAINELMKLESKPDAIVTASEGVSQYCLQVLKKYELQHQIAVAGYSNSEIAGLFDPPLSCVKQPAFEMGRLAAEMLINQLENKLVETTFETIILDTEFEINE